ncbi:MAG: ferredoxin family protein [Endomicrobiales bacterium]|nr:ferredoxin family protein [Endomicrobiales bacterium]
MSKVKIESEKCKGCYLCIEVCPKKCLEVSKEFNKKGYHPVEFVNDKECTGCGFCYQICPEVCIEVYK